MSIERDRARQRRRLARALAPVRPQPLEGARAASATPRPSTPSCAAASAPARSRCMDVGKETLAAVRRGLVAAVRRAEPGAEDAEDYATLWDAYILPRLGQHPAARADADGHQPLPPGPRGGGRRARLDRQDDDAASGRPAARVRMGAAGSPTRSARCESRSRRRKRSVTPLAPETVEEMRLWLLRPQPHARRDARVRARVRGAASRGGVRADVGATSASERCSSRPR